MDVIVEHGGKQIVGRCDCMKIASEVKVDFFHRHDLCAPPAGRSALHPKAWSERRFSNAACRALANILESIDEAYSCCGLTLACRCWRNCSDQHKFSERTVFEALDEVEVNFCFGSAIDVEGVFRDSNFRSNICDGLHTCGARNLNVAGHFPSGIGATYPKFSAVLVSQIKKISAVVLTPSCSLSIDLEPCVP